VAGVDKHKPFPDSALVQTFFDLAGDIDKGPAGRHLKPEFLAIAFHAFLRSVWLCLIASLAAARARFKDSLRTCPPAGPGATHRRFDPTAREHEIRLQGRTTKECTY